MWKLIIGTLALVFSASISEGGRFSDSKYFDNKLDEIQGAIDDTVKAGLDLRVMEGSLQRIVAASSYFFRTESATEYAVDAENYINGWIATDSNWELGQKNRDCATVCDKEKNGAQCDNSKMSLLTTEELVKSVFLPYGCKIMEKREGSGTPFTGNPAGTCVFFEESNCDGEAVKDQRNLCYCG